MSMIINPKLLIACCCFVQISFAQVNDGFVDGDFTVNPTWTGDSTKFTVASGELWLNAPAITDVAFLSTPSTVLPNTNWQFYNRMVFNPSSSNFCRFYLAADQHNFNAPHINGYYVELGRVSDEVSLYKVVNGNATKIIDGPDNMLNAAVCATRVKVTRTGNLWELLVDSTGGAGFISLGTAVDSTINETYFLGAYCKYTATRSNKFFFDDVVALGTNWVDAVDPYIIAHTVNANVLTLQLNEPMLASDLSTLNFSLDNGLTVLNVAEDSLDSRRIKVTASGNFSMNVLYHLHIGALHDLSGNISNNINYAFVLHTFVPGELVINEIMADPTPQVGLPNAEFIELRNNSAYPVNLYNWKLKVGNTAKVLPSYVFNPNEQVIITDLADTSLFTPFVHKLGIVSFPGLTNSGASIEILDTGNSQIDAVNYNLNWYHDMIKQGGGYTLERVNPFDFCMQEGNWRSSNDVSGGTPGFENSVWDTSLVEVGVSNFWIDNTHLLLVFNKWMDPADLVLAHFNLQNLMNVQVISNDSCILTLSSPLEINTVFNLTISSLHDCGGSLIPASLVVSVVNYSPQLFDVLIHELMVNETPAIGLPPSEYIELRNTRSFPLNLANWTLVVNGDYYTLGNYTIPADSFIVLAHENNVSLFPGLNTGGIISFGGLANQSGMIQLRHSNGTLFHAVGYSENYYDAPGKNNGGWSLEMIDTARPCLSNVNWTASQAPAGGTPGSRNSYTATIKDAIKPHAIKTGLENGNSVLIFYFDEPILPSSFALSNVVLSSGPIVNLAYSSPLLDEYKILLQSPLSTNSLYYAKLSGLTDCEGNILVADSLPYSIPSTAANFDIVINEVLADPTSNCIDYVEIYNRGANTYDLSQLIIGEGDTTTHLLTIYSPIHNQSVLLHPGEFIYISEDHEKVMDCYLLKDSTSYWDVIQLPDFANASGVVGISTNTQQWIDMFAYNDGMHFGGLNSTDGVSLERIDFNAATQNSMNWHSAAYTVGYGTPGYQNSQFSPSTLISDQFGIEPEVFSPDNDGYKDFVTIQYQLTSPGHMATLRIYDQAGRLEKDLVNNQLLGTAGSFIWDGTNNAGGKVNIGIHIIYFELTGANGEVIHFKKPVVVGARL